jgi:hypothetical protein
MPGFTLTEFGFQLSVSQGRVQSLTHRIPNQYEEQKDQQEDDDQPNRQMKPGVLCVMVKCDRLAHDDETILSPAVSQRLYRLNGNRLIKCLCEIGALPAL